MEVILDRDAFLKGLQMVQNIVEPRQTLPILANVLLETEEGSIRLTATDLEVGARVSIPARVMGKGAITVGARKLAEIVKELPAAAVALKVGDNAGVSLRCGGVTYKLVGMPPDDFPPVVPASPTAWLTLEAKTLRDMLSQTSFAISHDETRYALNGVLFSLSGTEMRLVATDGHRLALVSVTRNGKGKKEADENKAILPKKTLGELGRLLGEGDGDIGYERGENHLFFQVGDRMLISRMIDGQFPAYERVIPKGNDKHIEFERDRLTNAVKRVALLSNERSRAVKIQIEKGKVDVTSSSPDLGEAKETLPVEYSGSSMQICFNAQYVLDFLAAVATDVVSLELKDEVSQAVMKPVGAEGYDYTYVIMPMRV